MFKAIKDLVIPPWVKFVPIVLVLLMIGIQWKMISDRNDQISVFKANRSVLALELKVQPNHVTMLGKIKAIKQESENRRVTLETISRDAKASEQRSKEADKRLADAQERNRKALARSEATIKALQGRKGTGDVAVDDKAIEEDSKSPWKGWQAAGQFTPPLYSAVPLMDDHVWKKAQFGNSVVVVEVVIHPSYKSLRYSFEAQSGKQLGTLWLGAFSSYLKDGTCRMHVMDPRVDLKAWTWGHELLHCVYGSWHQERI